MGQVFSAIPLNCLCILLAILGFLNPTVATAGDENYISPEVVAGAKTISSPEAKALFDNGAFFVDIRKESDFEAGRIPGAYHIEFNNAEPAKTKLTPEALQENGILKDKDVVFYCNGVHCPRSSLAAQRAVEWGFQRVHYYRLGFPDWRSHGYPFE